MFNFRYLKKILSLLRLDGIFLLLAVLIFIIFWGSIAIIKYYHFEYNGLDLAIINQSLYLTVNGDIFGSTIHPPSYWADHFSPIILLLLVIYFWWSSPIALILMQITIVGLCAWPIYLIAKKIFPRDYWPIVLSILWLVNPYVQNIALFEFHLLVFGAFGILWMFYFYQNEKWWPFLISGMLTLSVREDLSLVVMIFGFLALFEKKSWRWILPPIIGAIVYFLFSLSLINIMSPTGSYKFLLYYSWLGNSFEQITFNALTKPWLIVKKIVSPGSALVGLALLLPLGLTPLLNPKYLLLSAAIFLQLISGTAWQWLPVILKTQYSSLLLPGVFIAGIYGINKALTDKHLGFKLFSNNRALMVLITAGLISTIPLGPIPSLLSNLKLKNYSDYLEKEKLLSHIPPEAAVASGYDSLANLSSRRQLASLNYLFLGKLQFGLSDYQWPIETEYILLNTQDYLSYLIQYQDHPLYFDSFKDGVINWPAKINGYGLLATVDTWALFKKQHQATKTLIIETEIPPELTINQPGLLLDIKFLGLNKTPNGELEFWWENNGLITPNTAVIIDFIKNKKVLDSRILPLGYGLLRKSDGFFGMLYNPPSSLSDLYDYIEISLTKIENGYLEIAPLKNLSTSFVYSTSSNQILININE